MVRFSGSFAMEAQCSVCSLLSGNQAARVSVWDGVKLGRLNAAEKEDMKKIIDAMGRLSAVSQRLRAPITDYERIHLGAQRLYLLTNSGPTRGTVFVKGLLKVGQKNLFIRKECGALVEINPLCILDFYVHVSCQRAGLGRQLFDAMLANEKKLPQQIGYDRPSQKLLSFLAKHYNLKRYHPQANQFVVYNAYFDTSCEDKGSVQSRPCDCIKARNSNTCKVALLETPRLKKEVLHGRRANGSPGKEATKIAAQDEAAKVRESPATPSIALRRRLTLTDDEVKATPSMSEVFSVLPQPSVGTRESHYDWMTGTRKPSIRSVLYTRGGPDEEYSPGSSGKGCPSFCEPDKATGRSPAGESPSPFGRRTAGPKTPKSNHRAQLSGAGAAAALGFKQP